ncbi:uncharacterized protein LOC114249105 isoform X1 [Bombyx mandarina]|uniref:Uncharacterized protein LOC114249105 isoform X1 n=1 Tax=Bombyx mandarina TaxID=7092 RepID=A0A6J2K9T7_BOMMA|nr:uncharacterized protein LOC114249105 isoform X1 [Bombyx mandarina]
MRSLTFVLLAAILGTALAVGQYYVPRSYYTIDSDGHESQPVPLRRLRRSLNPYPYSYNQGAEGSADVSGGALTRTKAKARSRTITRSRGSGVGDWGVPAGEFGDNLNVLRYF